MSVDYPYMVPENKKNSGRRYKPRPDEPGLGREVVAELGLVLNLVAVGVGVAKVFGVAPTSTRWTMYDVSSAWLAAGGRGG